MSAVIAFDAVSGPSSASATTLTFSHTTGSGSNRILFVAASKVAGNLISVTYAGVAMTLIANSGGNPDYGIYYLVNPTSGANNVVITTSGATLIQGAASSYTGALQSSPINTNSGTQSGSPIALNFTTTLDNCWLVAGGDNDNTNTLTAGAGTIVRASANAGGKSFSIIDSNSATSPAGADSLNATFAGGGNQRLSGAAFIPAAGDRYWVGGTGTWDASDTTHWSLTSGGVGGAAVPTVLDNVHFDASSGGGTATISATGNCLSINFTGYTGTFAGSSTLNVGGTSILYQGGNLTLGSGMTLTYTGTINFTSLTSGNTITTAGKTILGPIVFNGVGGGWTLQDSLTSSSTITGTAGNLIAGSNTITLTGSGTPWSMASTFGFTPGTSTIKYTDATSSTKTFAGGGLTYNNLWFTGSGTGAYTITGSNIFADFKVDTPPHTVNFTAGTTQYVQTFTVNGTAGNLMTLQSTSNGSTWYLRKITSGTVSCDYLSLRDSHAS